MKKGPKLTKKIPLIVFIANSTYLPIAKYHERELISLGFRVEILTEEVCLSAINEQNFIKVDSFTFSARIPQFIYAKVFIPYIFEEEDQII